MNPIYGGEVIFEWLAGVFGLLIGSFLNVCIYRWPRDLSVVSPRSHCPQCEGQISAMENIPLVSFLMLKGRCKRCGAHIPWRYPAVELLTSISFFYFVHHYGVTPAAIKYCFFSSLLIGLIFADIETLILPDQFTIGGATAGVAFAFLAMVPDSTFAIVSAVAGWELPGIGLNIGESLLGATLPAALLWLGGLIFEKVRHKEGLGFGDVKMVSMIGAFLGVRGCLLTIILGSVLGSVIGGLYILITRQKAGEFPLPFAAFLGAGGFLAAVVGPAVLQWYSGTLQP